MCLIEMLVQPQSDQKIEPAAACLQPDACCCSVGNTYSFPGALGRWQA